MAAVAAAKIVHHQMVAKIIRAIQTTRRRRNAMGMGKEAMAAMKKFEVSVNSFVLSPQESNV